MSVLFAPPQDILFEAVRHSMAKGLAEWTLVPAIETNHESPEKVVALQSTATEDPSVNAGWGDDDCRWWTVTATLNVVVPTDRASAVIMQLHRFMKELRGRRYEFEEGGVALIRSVKTLAFFSPTGQYALSGGKELTQEAGQYQISLEV